MNKKSEKKELCLEASTKQIRDKKQDIKYDTRDYVIAYLVEQFQKEEFYVQKDYQRNFVWNDKDKCLFIESVLMGLPIPFMFFSDTSVSFFNWLYI